MITQYSGHYKRGLSLLILCFFVAGCRKPLRNISEKDMLNRQKDFVASYQNDLQKMSQKTAQRIEHEYQNANHSDKQAEQSFDVLILSGGSAYGAFGAGFLEGWGRIHEPDFARPVFDSVSGISTGALIALYAFMGTSDSYKRVVEMYQNPNPDWVKKRSKLALFTGKESLFDVSELSAKIRSEITPELIKSLADGNAEKRLLSVAATNLDIGTMRVWDLTDLASKQPFGKAKTQIESIMLASTAIPGFFPPVKMDDYLYVDGGASMQVVSGIDDRSWAYDLDTHLLKNEKHRRPIRIRIWIIVNQKLLPTSKLIEQRWMDIAMRSVTTLMRSSTLQIIQDAETFVHLINQRPEFEAEMRYVAVPQDFKVSEMEPMFGKTKMRRLVELGQRMGADPKSWRSEALRPGAPFE